MKIQKGNPKGTPIGNPIRNPIGNPLENPNGNPIGKPVSGITVITKIIWNFTEISRVVSMSKPEISNPEPEPKQFGYISSSRNKQNSR